MSQPALKLADDDRRTYTSAARDQQAYEELRYFAYYAWAQVEPGRRLDWNWHIGLICDEIQDFTRPLWDPTTPDPDGNEMVICVPPRSLKSYTVSVVLQAWLWLRSPWILQQGISNDESLSTRDSLRTMQLIRSPWYQRLLRHAWIQQGIDPDDPDHNPEDPECPIWTISRQQAEKINFLNTKGGGRVALGVGSAITGKGADLQVIDDPYDAKSATRGSPQQVGRRMQQVVDDYDFVWRTRLNDPRRSLRLTIMQRLDPGDLAGVLLSRGVRRIVLPMEYDPEFPEKLGGIHPKDPRTKLGQLLMPVRWTAAIWAAMKAVREAIRHLEAQFNQRPRSKEGGLFKEQWFAQRYPEDPQILQVDQILIHIDATFKETADGSFVVIQVWGRRGKAAFYLLDQVRERMEFYRMIQIVLNVKKKWPRATGVIFEDKANGPAAVSILRREIPGVDEWNPGTKSKYERAEIGSVPPLQAGQVWFPADVYAPWLPGYIERHVAFDGTGSVPDDEIDTTSQALLRWTGGGLNPLELLKARLGGLI